MAGLRFMLEYKEVNGFNHNNVPAKEYLIRYQCRECNQTHSVRVKVQKFKNEIHFIYPPKAKMKVRVWRDEAPKNALMLFGAMKILDGLNIKYLPDSVRLVKA
ncbi:MAG: hypothetical protein QXK47_03990 [Candidatus Bathyarchaeia archaeon]